MMYSLDYAIKAVTREYGGKICQIAENKEAYFIQRAEDDGTVVLGCLPIMVDKETGGMKLFLQSSSSLQDPPKKIPLPDGYGDIFVKATVYE